MRSIISEGQCSPKPPVPHLAMLQAMLLLEVCTRLSRNCGTYARVEGDSCHCGGLVERGTRNGVRRIL